MNINIFNKKKEDEIEECAISKANLGFLNVRTSLETKTFSIETFTSNKKLEYTMYGCIILLVIIIIFIIYKNVMREGFYNSMIEPVFNASNVSFIPGGKKLRRFKKIMPRRSSRRMSPRRQSRRTSPRRSSPRRSPRKKSPVKRIKDDLRREAEYMYDDVKRDVRDYYYDRRRPMDEEGQY